LRLVCQKLRHVASSVADLFVSFPISDSNFCDEAALEYGARQRSYALLSEPFVAVRRFTLRGGPEESYMLEDISHARVKRIAHLLRRATLLEHLIIRREYDVAIPLLGRLAKWPKLHRLDLYISDQSSHLSLLEGSRLRHLTLRLTPHDEHLNEIPALPLLTRLKIQSIWPPYGYDRDLEANTRLNFERYPKLKWLKLFRNAPE
jgi:hypothetical protein